MIIAFGGGGGYFKHACLLANERETSIDMFMIGNFGKDQDDEKALTMAVALKRIGIIGDLSVVANLGDARLRAQLAKGTVKALGLPDVPVVLGTHGGLVAAPTRSSTRTSLIIATTCRPRASLSPSAAQTSFSARWRRRAAMGGS